MKRKETKTTKGKVMNAILKTCLVLVIGFIGLAIVSVIFEDDVSDVPATKVSIAEDEKESDTIPTNSTEEIIESEETTTQVSDPKSTEEPEVYSPIEYGYYYNNTIAAVIDFDESIASNVINLFVNNGGGYSRLYTGYIISLEDGTYEASDVNNKTILNLSFDGPFVDIAVSYSEYDVPEEVEGTYELRDSDDSIEIPNRARYVSDADELKELIRYDDSIGITFKFIAEVGGNYSQMGEYLLYLYTSDRSSFLQIRTTSDGTNLFDGDIIEFEGVFNGFTGGGNQLSFTTVSIEIQ